MATWQDLYEYLKDQAESYDFDMTRYQHPFTHTLLSNLEDFLEAEAKGIDEWWADWNIGHGGGINADQVDNRHYSEFLLVDLADTQIASPQANQSLVYDGNKWKNQYAGDGTLAGLTDTSISSPDDGEVIVFRTSDDKWHNESATAVDDKKVKASSSDPTPGYLDAKRNASVIVSSNKLQLQGDNATPGNEKYYGTNSGGTKGFYALPDLGTAQGYVSITFSTILSLSWGAMPSGLTEFLGATQHRTKYDLTNASSARLVINLEYTGAVGAELRAQYSTDQSTWYYLDNVSGPLVSLC